jgi:hypothetical protein
LRALLIDPESHSPVPERDRIRSVFEVEGVLSSGVL